jgi:hypothetical protein
MTALAAERNTDETTTFLAEYPLSAAVKAYAGGIAVIDGAGNVRPGVTGKGFRCVGRFESTADNSNGAAAAISVLVRSGVFQFANSASTDAITKADVGRPCYIVDDQTVAKLSNSGSRSQAGIVFRVDTVGVWVFMAPNQNASGTIKSVQVRVTTLVGTNTYRVPCPFSGKVVQVYSVIEGALTTGDATLTAKIGSTAITGGVLTITQSGSAAGDVDEAVPTAANTVLEGGVLSVTVGGTNDAAVAANVVFLIQE